MSMVLWGNSASRISAAVANGKVSVRAVADHFLARSSALDPHLLAWSSLDSPGTLGQATAYDGSDGPRGLLAGVPIGVKDVIDVRGFATRAGSKTRETAVPAERDAAVVARMRAAGAIVMGKTVTTEYATMDPAPTRNPYRAAHTPGGSSSGSAAVVGAGMAPLALGTQTAGSLCRPAAYCGVAAYKPSFGIVPTEGIVPLAPSFDTVGVIGRRIADVRLAGAVLTGPIPMTDGLCTGAVACLRPAIYGASTREVHDLYATAAGILRCEGFSVVDVDLAVDLDQVVLDHRTVMASESFTTHGHLLGLPEGALGRHFGGLLAEGRAAPEILVREARERLEGARETAWNRLREFSAILLQPVPAPAPAGLGATGPTHYLVPWTAFGGPLVVVPGGLSSRSLPLAVMIGAAPGNDSIAFDIAERLARYLDTLPDAADGAWAADLSLGISR
jgi:aspartyl-tRNA(Asn)/glutamyl-tRNA(Gln) amidotransferase subunit A